MFYIKNKEDGNWTIHGYDETAPVMNGQNIDIKSISISFDENGNLKKSGNFYPQLIIPSASINGSKASEITISINQLTQQESDNKIYNQKIDGYGVGKFIDYTISDSGKIIANYNNGQNQLIAQIAMANFTNPSGLKSTGENCWIESEESGSAMLGMSGSGGFGQILGQKLESSNVDISNELVKMMIQQSNYQSNAQTIKTQDQLLQVLVNMRHRAIFEDLLYQTIRQPGSKSSEQTVLPSGLQIGTGVRPSASIRIHLQGGLTNTGNETDLAIEGQGFFQILMPDGTNMYTRDGSFQLDQYGQLVTSNGYPVQPSITIPNGSSNLSISRDGIVSVTVPGQTQPQEIGQITLSTFANISGLENVGENLYRETQSSGSPIDNAPGINGAGSLKQKFVENSNVNIAEELITMIQAQRAYELNKGSTTIVPNPPLPSFMNGAIFQPENNINYGYQPLFEDRRPRNIGDILTVLLQENVSASKSTSTNASRKGNTNLDVSALPNVLNSVMGNNRLTTDVNGNNSFNGKGGAAATNTFHGTITVTVMEILTNGNLRVAGEKKISINQGTESIRFSERIRDLTTIVGIRDNVLIGYGLVVGLDGTGDQTTQTPFTVQSLRNMLSQLGVTVPSGINMQLKNIAAVMVTAKLPPFANIGQKIDVIVSSLGSAKSLRGGTLLITPLKGVDNQVYAFAQGNILISGFGAQSGGNNTQINQLNGGRIHEGAIIEKSIKLDFNNKEVITLQLNNNDFSLAQQISDAINTYFGKKSAHPINSKTIQVSISRINKLDKIELLARLQNIPIMIGPSDAIIVINSRTGSVVINREVVLNNCAVAHGELTVEIKKTNKVNQPNTILGGGSTVVTPETEILIKNQGDSLQEISSSTSLNAVIASLNSIGAKPNDLMAILESMKTAGCLNAKIEVN
uniref:Flagellar hook protein FlgE n=1 Tax=Glossina pallidipes TaxID=7398 RepID=A0A1A9Z125_GLOPL